MALRGFVDYLMSSLVMLEAAVRAAGSSFSRWGCCRLLSARYTLSREVTALGVASGWW